MGASGPVGFRATKTPLVCLFPTERNDSCGQGSCRQLYCALDGGSRVARAPHCNVTIPLTRLPGSTTTTETMRICQMLGIPPFRGGMVYEEPPCQRHGGRTTPSSENGPCGS